MTEITISLPLALAALPIMLRCLCIVHRMSRKHFAGNPLHFLGLGASFIAIGTGALCAAVMAWMAACLLLFTGVLGLVLLDRRQTLCLVLDGCQWGIKK